MDQQTKKPFVSPPQLHFDDGSRVMSEQQHHSSPLHVVSPRGSTSIKVYFEIDRMAQEIFTLTAATSREDDYSFRVALQFPDELLSDAPMVCWAMEEALGPEALVFVLGDTTFGPCCPDEVSALHLEADVLVHYGNACLSPARSLPVVYSFGITDMNVEACVDAILKQVKQEEKPLYNLLLLYEVRYQHALKELESQLKERGGFSVLVGQIPRPCCISQHDATNDKSSMEHETADHEEQLRNNEKFVVGGLELPKEVDLSSHTLLFVGDDNTQSRQYVNIMLRFLSMNLGPTYYWTYSPALGELQTELPPTLRRQLNRRFYLTQKARDASVYGILVGTLSQQHFQSVVSTLQRVIQDAGKSCYTFAVGKINGAKLANFGEIECFVLVACGENSLLDNERDLHVPVITPLELDVALGNAEWGFYSLDYNDFLAQQTERPASSGNDEDAPYFSLISGKFVDSKKLKEGVDLTALPGKGQLAEYKSEAAEYLRKREYQGLKIGESQKEAHAAVQGLTGIASDYGNR